MYGEWERGGGGRQRDGHRKNRRGKSIVEKGTLLKGDACQRVEGLKTIAGGAVSFAPSPTPKPSTTSRTGRGGVQTYIWDAGFRKPGEDIGRPIAGGLVAFLRTDDGGRTMGDQTLKEVG